MAMSWEMLARRSGLLGAGLVAALGLAGPARAGLIGAGRTVQVLYYNGSTASANTENESTLGGPGPVSIASAGANFLSGAISGSTVQVTNTQIIITDTAAAGTPYCSNGAFSGTGCTDQISGFALMFAGENITGVSVNAAGSATSMTPVTGTAPPYSFAHSGLQLINANQILIDLTGALPAGTLTLTLDVTTLSPTTTPEPASAALLGVGLLGLAVASRRRRLPF